MTYKVYTLRMKPFCYTLLLVTSGMKRSITMILAYRVVISNKTEHERNIAYSGNTKLPNFASDKLPNTNRVFSRAIITYLS